MSSKKAILRNFIAETHQTNNSYNNFAASQLINSGKEISIFTSEKKKGISIENPLSRLYSRSVLDRDEYDAAMNYCNNYELANISHHARPSYDSVRASTNKKDHHISQNQIDASKKINDANKSIFANNFFKNPKNKIINRRYIEILNLIFEQQMCMNAVQSRLNMSRLTIERKIKEICKILVDNENQRNYRD
jgi:hypothetical protein